MPISAITEHESALGLAASHMKESDVRLQLKDAAAAHAAGRFMPGNSPVLNFGIGSQPVWIHLAVDNPTGAVLQRRLSIETAWLDSVEVYFQHQGRTVAKSQVGDAQPFNQRPVKARFFVLDHAFDSGLTDVYLRVATPDPMVVPIYLMEVEAARIREAEQEHGYGIVYGYVLALLAYNVILFIGLRRPAYLLYSVYLAMFLVTNAAYTGHGFAWLWPESVRWQLWSNPTLMMLFALSGFMFAIQFLDLRAHSPRLYKGILIYCAGAAALYAATVVFGSQLYALLVAFAFVALFTVIMLLLGIVSVRSGQKPAQYFLLAAVTAMAGAALTNLSVWGFIPYTKWTFHAVEIGMLADATLLALALAYQFRVGQEEKIRAEQLAQTDPLTGLNNRRAFYDRTGALWSMLVRKKRDVSVILLDIDLFKRINDSYGHKHGDEVLIAIAKVLLKSIRQGDVLARWGGEEFIVFLPETNIQEAIVLAERLRAAIASLIIRNAAGQTTVTASLGVAQKDDQHTTLDTLISSADEYLYQSKQQGRNRVSFCFAEQGAGA